MTKRTINRSLGPLSPEVRNQIIDKWIEVAGELPAQKYEICKPGNREIVTYIGSAREALHSALQYAHNRYLFADTGETLRKTKQLLAELQRIESAAHRLMMLVRSDARAVRDRFGLQSGADVVVTVISQALAKDPALRSWQPRALYHLRAESKWQSKVSIIFIYGRKQQQRKTCSASPECTPRRSEQGMHGIEAMSPLTNTSKRWSKSVGAQFGESKFRTGPSFGNLSWKLPPALTYVSRKTRAANGSGGCSISDDGQIGVDSVVICPLFERGEVSIKAPAASNKETSTDTSTSQWVRPQAIVLIYPMHALIECPI